jgi:hypothetical protein
VVAAVEEVVGQPMFEVGSGQSEVAAMKCGRPTSNEHRPRNLVEVEALPDTAVDIQGKTEVAAAVVEEVVAAAAVGRSFPDLVQS